MPPQQVQQPSQGPSTPLFQTECWYIPKGTYTIFSYRKCIIVLHPGQLVVYRKSDNAELQRIQLTNDLRIKYFLGFARISYVGGRKISLFNASYSFLISPVWSYALIMLGALIDLVANSIALNTGERSTSAAFVALLVMLAGFGVMASGTAKAKALVAACKGAAGVA